MNLLLIGVITAITVIIGVIIWSIVKSQKNEPLQLQAPKSYSYLGKFDIAIPLYNAEVEANPPLPGTPEWMDYLTVMDGMVQLLTSRVLFQVKYDEKVVLRPTAKVTYPGYSQLFTAMKEIARVINPKTKKYVMDEVIDLMNTSTVNQLAVSPSKLLFWGREQNKNTFSAGPKAFKDRRIFAGGEKCSDQRHIDAGKGIVVGAAKCIQGITTGLMAPPKLPLSAFKCAMTLKKAHDNLEQFYADCKPPPEPDPPADPDSECCQRYSFCNSWNNPYVCKKGGKCVDRGNGTCYCACN